MAIDDELGHMAKGLVRDLEVFNKVIRSNGDQLDTQDKRQLLINITGLLETLENPEIAVWKVIFGVSRIPICN